MRDEDYGAALTLAEGDDGLWSPPMAAPACEPRDWRSLYEQAYARAEKERARADTAQARAEQRRRAEVDSRSRAGSLKCQLDTCRHKLKAAAEQTKEVRRASKDALFFQAEVARLETLLSQAGVESSKRTTIVSLRMEVARLRTALQASQARTERLEGLALPVPHKCSLDFMKPLRYRGHHGDSESGQTPPAGQSLATSHRARRGVVEGYQKPWAGGRSRL